MNPCLNAMEARLTDLLHTGLDTGAVDSAADFRRLAERCAAARRWGRYRLCWTRAPTLLISRTRPFWRPSFKRSIISPSAGSGGRKSRS